MRMPLPARREYLKVMHQRYLKARSKAEKARLIEEVMATLGYHRSATSWRDPSTKTLLGEIARWEKK